MPASPPWFLRLALKPVLSSGLPLSFKRRWVDRSARWLRAPPDCRFESMRLAGLPTLRIVPANALNQRSVLYVHGGGHVLGGLDSHRRLAAHIAVATRSRVWLPQYRLAPEHPQPAALKDGLAAYAELLEAGRDPEQLVLAGDASGAGLVLSMAVAIRDADWPPPAALVLISPWVDLTLNSPTLHSHARRDALLSPAWLQYCASAYRGSAAPGDPACSPLFADLRDLPPVLVQVGSEEILLSDAERLAMQVEAVAGSFELQRYDGLWHGFHHLAGRLPAADAALAGIGAFVDSKLAP